MKWILMALALVIAGHVQAANDGLRVLHGHLEQAGYLAGMVTPGTKVYLDGEPVWVGEKGQMMVAFDRMAKPKMVLKICETGKTCAQRELTLKQRTYEVQNVRGIPAKTVNPDPKHLERMKGDNAAIGGARSTAVAKAGDNDAFLRLFKLPIEGVTTGVFGSRRTYNGEERSWHKGRDFAAPIGTPVKAPADGVVRLARDTFMNGNIVLLDHGGGMTTAYAHLNKMLVKPGDVVKEGDVFAEVGNTGRSSGPHLHWGAYWKNMAIDPMLWVKP